MGELKDEVFVKEKKLKGLQLVKIDFSKVKDVPISSIYGDGIVSAGELAKFIWSFIKANNLRV
jgi:hypothetical protein